MNPKPISKKKKNVFFRLFFNKIPQALRGLNILNLARVYKERRWLRKIKENLEFCTINLFKVPLRHLLFRQWLTRSDMFFFRIFSKNYRTKYYKQSGLAPYKYQSFSNQTSYDLLFSSYWKKNVLSKLLQYFECSVIQI